MFGTIRKHQTWLWAVIITVTIISFVVFFSPTSKLNSGSRGTANFGSIDGEKVTPDEYYGAQREVLLQYFFRSGGSWPGEEAKQRGFDLLREGYYRLFIIRRQEKAGIRFSENQVDQVAREMIQSLERFGVTSPDVFAKQVLNPQNLTLADFGEFVRHELGLQEMMSCYGLPGRLVTPQEARSVYVREHEDLSTEAVFFSVSNYLASVTVTPETISEFYSNRMANYRIPDRVQVSYVKFPISNYLANAEEELTKSNLTELVQANVQRMGTNLFRDAKTPEESKQKIREELIRGRALGEARKQAVDLARPLFEMDPVKAENLEIMARSNHLEVHVSAPFSMEEGPKDIDAGPDFAKQAFALTPQDPFHQPIVGEDGVYLIAFHKTIPSEIPSLDLVRDKVTADYKYSEALARARKTGQDFNTTLTNGLAQGKSFAVLATDAGFKPVELPPFSISTASLSVAEVQDHLSFDQLKQIAFSTPVGQTSGFQFTPDGGTILRVKARLPLDEAKLTTELPGFTARLRQARQNEAFNQWFRHEAERGLADVPALRQAPAQNMGARKS